MADVSSISSYRFALYSRAGGWSGGAVGAAGSVGEVGMIALAWFYLVYVRGE